MPSSPDTSDGRSGPLPTPCCTGRSTARASSTTGRTTSATRIRNTTASSSPSARRWTSSNARPWCTRLRKSWPRMHRRSRCSTGMVPMVGRGLWNPWTVLEAKPIGSDKTFRMGWATDIDGTNPLSITSAVESLRLVYDFLARVDKAGQPIPWAAESWRKVTDTQVDVTLRQGMTFHDGRPVTVEDVVFSFEFIRQNGTAPYFSGALEPIRSVRAVNNRVIRFVLHYPYPPLLMVTFTQIPILPKHIWQDVVSRERVETPAKWNNPNPIGSGPYQFGHWRRGEELLLRRYARHFHPPQAEAFLAVKYASADAVFQAIVQGGG